MTPEMMIKLRKSLIQHEGYRNFPYLDTIDKITIGIGCNLSDCGIDDEWINRRYQMDVNFFFNRLSSFDWFHSLNEDRQIVLIDMAFMGWKKFLGFTELLDALERHDYARAAEEMLDSEWASQVKDRAVSLAQGMLSGVYNP